MKKQSGIQIARIITLVFFLVLITVIATLHQVIGGGPKGAPSIDSLCPFGGLEIIYSYLTSAGEFIKRTNVSNFILLGGTIALAVVVGRFFCGWICMLGFLQELFGKIGKKIFKKNFVIPAKVERPLRFLKYAVLFIVIILTWRTGELIIRPYDPFAAYAHIPAGLELFNDFLWGIIILIISLVASMFVDRFFCKYLCPMGAFLGIVNKLSIFRIKRSDPTCIHCSKCTNICPVNIDVEKTAVVRSSECINCMECITVCPTLEKKTMSANIVGKFVNPAIVVVIGLGLYVGIIGISMITNVWKTQEPALEETVKDGEKLNPDDIRGYMTMEEIATAFKIDIDEFYTKAGLTKEIVPINTQMKKVQELSGKEGLNIGENEIKNAVREILGLPLVEYDEENAKSDIKDEKEETTKGVALDPADIKGSMTIKEVSDAYGVDIDKLYEQLDIKKDKIPVTTAVREIKNILSADGRSFEVQEVRDAVVELNS